MKNGKKNSKILIIVVGIIAALSVGLLWLSASRPKIMELGSLSYAELCKKNGDQWMVMEPWIKGKAIGGQACAGCMIADSHFCTAEEYISYMEGLPMMAGMMENGMMHGMEYEAMTAHGGNEDSVDIHMYTVKFLRNKLENSLDFEIMDMLGKPVSDLEVVHDKIMHVVLVRDDLKYFDHIHPKQIADGAFNVPYEFYSPGNYRVWVDFTIGGMQHIVDFDFNIAKGSGNSPDYSMDDINVKLNPINTYAGKTAKIGFTVNYKDGRPAKIQEKFLAANAHLIAIDETLDEFGHAHDEKFDGDNDLSFTYKFAKTGRHKLWLQFSLDKVTRTAEFEIDVSE